MRSVGDLGCYSDNYKQGPFSAFLSYLLRVEWEDQIIMKEIL